VNKKLIIISCGLTLILILGLLYFLFLEKKEVKLPRELKQEYLKFKKEYLKKKNQGYDLREAT